MKTAIILVTHNKWAMTEECLKKLSSLPSQNFVVAVADNASTDDTRINIRKDFPNIFLTEIEQNAGFGTANNRAVQAIREHCEIDSICLLNNDTLPEIETFIALQNDITSWNETHPETPAVFSPDTRNKDGSEQINYYADIPLHTFFTNAFRTEKAASHYLHGTPEPEINHPEFMHIAWTSAICWMMNISLWDACCGFDEKIFMYYEDVDFAWRANALGAIFLLDTRLKLTHLGGGSVETPVKQALQHDNSQEYVFRKRWGRRGYLVSKIFKCIRSGIRIAISLPLAAFSVHARKLLCTHIQLLRNALCRF
jgi:N-acetylglucosaminyl-diphospho-decaprenol L-rhamnosyltransferase